MGAFHRGLSLVLLALADLIASIALLRNHADWDVLLLASVILVIGAVGSRHVHRTAPTGGIVHATGATGEQRW